MLDLLVATDVVRRQMKEMDAPKTPRTGRREVVRPKRSALRTCSETSSGRPNACEALPTETPARSATSRSRTRFCSPCGIAGILRRNEPFQVL